MKSAECETQTTALPGCLVDRFEEVFDKHVQRTLFVLIVIEGIVEEDMS